MSEDPATCSAMVCVWWCLHQLHPLCPFRLPKGIQPHTESQPSKCLNFKLFLWSPHSIPKIGARTRRWGSHSASQQKLPWNPVLKTVPWQQGRDALDHPGGLVARGWPCKICKVYTAYETGFFMWLARVPVCRILPLVAMCSPVQQFKPIVWVQILQNKLFLGGVYCSSDQCFGPFGEVADNHGAYLDLTGSERWSQAWRLILGDMMWHDLISHFFASNVHIWMRIPVSKWLLVIHGLH